MPRDFISLCSTFGEETLRYTNIGASDVLATCAGWLIVSQSSATSCIVLANSKILSISAVTSDKFEAVRLFDLSINPCLLPPIGLDCSALLAKLMSAVTLVIMILFAKRCFIKSNIAFCIISVTSKPFKDGPINITGLIEGTTS